jgi:hypothetical protein
MRSPEHRANILDRRYRLTGIGVYRRGGLTIYTQDFSGICRPRRYDRRNAQGSQSQSAQIKTRSA